MKSLIVPLLLLSCVTPPRSEAQPPIAGRSPVIATNLTPDKVATDLMPVPIYNFAVHNLAFSPDGKTLATGDGYGIVRLWDVSSGALKSTIQAHTNWAFSIAWARNGKFIMTGGGDALIHQFPVGSSQPAKTFEGHDRDVHSLVMTPDDAHIISAGDDREIFVWDLASGKNERKWLAHDKQIPTVTLSPDGKTLASGSRDHSIRLWDWQTGTMLHKLEGHKGDVMSVRFSPDGKMLASASYDKMVKLWDPATGELRRTLEGHTNRVFTVAFSPDGQRLATAGDSTLRIWNPKSGEQITTIVPGGKIVSQTGLLDENLSCVQYSPDGKLLAVSSTTGEVFLISTKTGAVMQQLAAANAEGQQPIEGGAAKGNIGRKIEVRGTFHLDGKFGAYVLNGEQQVYLVPRTTPFSWGPEYAKLEKREVLATGVLRFSPAQKPPTGSAVSALPDYYYFDLEGATVAPAEKAH